MTTYRANTNRKVCAYYECKNNSLSNPKLTFFAFPKQSERLEIWLKLGGVLPDVTESKMNRFLCERHFSDIYLSRTPRRTLLMPNAIPFPYDESELELEMDDGITLEEYETQEEETEEMPVDASHNSDDSVSEIKDSQISEFIFKGEEYVQMPKSHYLKKINGMKRSLAFYENIVQNLREILDHAKASSSLEN
uniref:THAP-type domain-containing protein n=1 Tax=Anopheles farauti TaxID=69004 RepID=A0A182Q2F4_9DIPT